MLLRKKTIEIVAVAMGIAFIGAPAGATSIVSGSADEGIELGATADDGMDAALAATSNEAADDSNATTDAYDADYAGGLLFGFANDTAPPVIPEPGTFMLLASGLLGIAVKGRRQRS